MNNQPRILALAGSNRRHSLNQRLVRLAAQGAEQAGALVNVVDLAEYPMPLFSEDLEQSGGLPESAEALRSLMLQHQGLLLASPEYNGSLTAVLKNALDWLSRPHADGRFPFNHQAAVLLSASPGSLGGLRGLDHARTVLTNLGAMVLPQQFALPAAHEAFGDDGALLDAALHVEVLGIGARLARTTQALQAAEYGREQAAA